MAQPFFKASTAFYLIDDTTLCGTKDSPVQSGWDFDSRECKYTPSEKSNILALATDLTSRYDVFIKRKILRQNDGTLGFHFSFTSEKSDGFFLSFYSEESSKSALEITVSDGTYFVNGENTGVEAKNKDVIFDGALCLDQRKAYIYIDDSRPVEVFLNCTYIDTVKIGAKAHTETVIFPHRFHMWKNYFICDRYSPNLSRNWVISESKNAAVTCDREYSISCFKDGKASLCQRFSATTESLEFEMKYLLFEGSGMCRISLNEKDNDAFFVTDDGQSLCFEGKTIKKHLQNVWQTLRIIADSGEKKTVIYLNGKRVGEYAINASLECFDGIKVEFSSTYGGVLCFCDITASPAENLPEDYVSEPVLPKKKDYIIGINTCSLWRNGYHRSWDVITPFDENKTYLGYYDEGTSEVSDLEIKWMAENGLELTVKDGVIAGFSKAFDPQMLLTNLNISADRIKSIGITIKGGMPQGSDDYATLYFKTDSCGAWSENKSRKCRISPSKKQMCLFDFSTLASWNGNITEFRLDPLSSEGSFEIYSFELFDNGDNPSITFNGIAYSPCVPICQKNGKVYIPFESGTEYGNLKIYSEWNKTAKKLLIVYENISLIFTVGESFCTVNGKTHKLDEPLYQCDGLPMLDLNFLCEIFRLSLSVDGKRIQVSGV